LTARAEAASLDGNKARRERRIGARQGGQHMGRKLGFMAAALGLAALPASAQNTVRIAYIDPLSGAFANVGDTGLRHFQFLADKVNAAGGVAGGKKLEVVGFDNETNPEKSLIVLKKAIDDGIRIVTQGNGSSVAYAISDAVAKHNKRNPEQAVLYLNYAAVDPGLTNEKCNFWHFRWDADVDMKMAALTNYMAAQERIKKVYVFNQDYSFGQSVEKAALEMLPKRKPGVDIVGAERIPLGKVKDFAPYVAKMQAGNVDSIVTGNWGNDITLLIKAAQDNGFKATFYTYYAGGLGTPAAMGASGKGTVQVTEWHNNIEAPEIEKLAEEFEAKTKQDLYYWRVVVLVNMVAKAMNDAKSADPLKVALALEGMKWQTPMGEIWMRKDNHQIVQPLFISTFTDGVKHDVEKTGLGFKTNAKIEAKETELPTTCKMERPS
jgi:branched-chain amino acid transport system substrate-binding protein